VYEHLLLLKTQSGEDDKCRVNRRTSFEGYRKVDLGMIQGALSVRRARDDFRCRDFTPPQWAFWATWHMNDRQFRRIGQCGLGCRGWTSSDSYAAARSYR
jgi:hypothetical protein